ncbi:MAG TPA: nucleoside recognition domain-containing protein [Anaerovoracaceae bacterium]|nr:nucleoside recognition domain-containing protein [Anaerovoracaceae bacterium]
MNLFAATVRNGAINGVKTTLMLLKIVIPVYVVVTLLKYSPIMPFLQNLFSPAMKFFHLSGDGVVPLITGFFTDEYVTIAVMSTFDFTKAEITTIAMFVLVAHSIPVESAIAQKIGMSAAKFAVFRILSAIAVGLLVGWVGGLMGGLSV